MALTQISTAGVKDDAVTSGKIPANAVGSSELADNAVDNAAVVSNAAIAGTKISPDFGSQNIATTGHLSAKDIYLNDPHPTLYFTDSNGSQNYIIQVDSGHFLIYDSTNSANRLKINSDGHIDIDGNADFGAGIDVTGDITATGNINVSGYSQNHFVPLNNNAVDLGFSNKKWRNVYATTLYGDGSNLTGITSTTINSNADNRVITGSGTANTLNGESGLTYDGDNLNVSAGAHDSGLHVTAANNNQETRFSLIGKASDGTSHTWLLNAKRSANRLDFVGGGQTRASILSTGEFGIGTTAQQSLLQVGGGTNPMTAKPTFHVAPSSGDATMSLRGGSPSIYFDGTGGGNAKLLTDGTDLTISSGNLDSNGTFRHYLTQYGHFAAKGDAGSWVADPGSSSNLYHQFCNTGNGRWVMRVQQEHHNGMVMQLRVNSTSNQEALQVQKYTSTASTRFQVLHSGNCANANNSFGAISDIKLKENIVDAKSQWDDVKAVKVRNFNLKEEKDTKLLGVVAQEIETVSSSLIFETIDRDPDDSTKEIGTTKNVKYSVLYMKAFKALQEAMAKIEVLETKVAALEAA